MRTAWLMGLLLIPRLLRAEGLEALVEDDAIWTMDRDEVMAKAQPWRFVWTSIARDSARSARPDLEYHGFRVWEAVLWCGSNGVRNVVLSLYNRGDGGIIRMESFTQLVQQVSSVLTTHTNVKPVSKDISRSAGIPKQTLTWTLDSRIYQLEWSASAYRERTASATLPEYLRLTLRPAGTAAPAGTTAVSGLALVKKAVQKLPNGDVWLNDVPMVDQGDKGYCAAAVTERVLKYYGTAYDEHEAAQIFSTFAGTDPETMKKALRRVSMALRIKLNVIEDTSVDNFFQGVNAYNTVAKKKKQPEILLPRQGAISAAEVYRAMDPDLYVESKTKNAAPVGRFKDKVSQSISRKVPLIWGVILGMVKEPDIPQAFGGHMRLIIGYNDKTREILYSDSWGAGHELKRMPLDRAFAITTGLFSIEPR